MNAVVELDRRQLELAQRTALECVARDMRNAVEQIERLAEVAPWPANGNDSSDAQATVSLVRETLRLVDALGWPAEKRDTQRQVRNV